MSEVSARSLQLHDTIRSIRLMITIVSLVLAVPAMGVIILCATRISKRYSSLLALVCIQFISIDLVRELVYDPIMLLPETCTLREHPLIPIPGGTNLYTELWVGVTTLTVPLVYACFLERHQAVQPLKSRWSLPMGVRYVSIGIVCAGALGLTSLLVMAEMKKDTERALLQTIKSRWPTLPVERAECLEHVPYTIFLTSSVLALGACALITALMSWHTFASLKVATTLSDKMKSLNSSLTRVLVIQATAPLFLMILPLFFTLISVINAAEGPLPFSICFLFMSFHPPVHSIILLTQTPMYRKKVIEFWNRASFFCSEYANLIIQITRKMQCNEDAVRGITISTTT